MQPINNKRRISFGKPPENPFFAFFKDLVYLGLESFGRYYSCYRAYVNDNEDPDKLNRLKLIIPQLNGQNIYHYWAWPKNNFAGKNYGIQLLPQKGDVVWITFEQGKPEYPIWEHGYFATDEKPTDDEDLNDPNCYWMITPKGIRLKLNDTKNYISIYNRSGDEVRLTENGVSIIASKSISLGSLDSSKEPGVLGDTLYDLLTKMIDDLGNLGAIQTNTGITSKINSATNWLPFKTKWKNELKKFKSKKITLD